MVAPTDAKIGLCLCQDPRRFVITALQVFKQLPKSVMRFVLRSVIIYFSITTSEDEDGASQLPGRLWNRQKEAL
jgi:hypothetical protein